MKECLENMTSASLQPQILLPAQISRNTETVKLYIPNNIPGPGIKTAIAGNIRCCISDQLIQFFILH